MADEQTGVPGEAGKGRVPGKSSDPDAFLKAMFPGYAWTQAMLEGPMRSQAGVAAETLRKLNAPLLDTLAFQKDLAESLAATADQMSAMSRQLERLARQHKEVTERLEAALEPYLRYVDWLTDMGAGKRPGSRDRGPSER